MEEKMIEEINEGVVDTVCNNDVSNSNGGAAVAATVIVITLVVGGLAYLYNRKKKKSYCEFKTAEVIEGSNLNDEEETAE